MGMRVADADDADGRPVLGRAEGSAAQGEEDGVDESNYDCQWGLDEAFEEGGRVPFRLPERPGERHFESAIESAQAGIVSVY